MTEASSNGPGNGLSGLATTVVVGNPKPRSRTWQAAHLVCRTLTGQDPDHAVDLSDLGPALFDRSSEAVQQAVDAVSEAELVIIASPTYKATFTGLLKLFLERFAAGELTGRSAVPLMLGGDLHHSLAAEVFLKPVLNEIGLSTPTSALFLVDRDYEDPAVLEAWAERARIQLR